MKTTLATLTTTLSLLIFSQTSLSAAWYTPRGAAQRAAVHTARAFLGKNFVKHSVSYKSSEKNPGMAMTDEPYPQEEFLQKFPHIDNARAVDIYYIVGVLEYLFDKHKMIRVEVGGTLLGMLRNHGLLPHDDDADYAVVMSSKEMKRILGPELKQFGLALRSAPGIGIQVYPIGGRTVFGLSLVCFTNTLFSPIPIKALQKDMTYRGFVDLMPIKKVPGKDFYRYDALFAQANWFHDILRRELVEGSMEDYRFGPLIVRGPNSQQAHEAINKSYPNAMTHIQRTPGHTKNEKKLSSKLVPLTPEQKQPFPLTEEDLTSLNERFEAAGFVLNDGRIAPQREKSVEMRQAS